ncbi:MAG: iron chelate uptake ABC transporter family permease subunit [Caldilineaceae bacterium]
MQISLGRSAARRPALWTGILLGVGLLLGAMLLSIAFGAADIAPADVWTAVFAFDPSRTDHLIIRTLQAPQAAVAALVGSVVGRGGRDHAGAGAQPAG